MLIILAGITIISASSLSLNEAMAFPHASLIIEPGEEHANPIELVLGHTDEPAFGKLPGIHDGKHFVEVRLLDERTTLPIQGGQDFNENGAYISSINDIEKIMIIFHFDKIQII